MPLFYFDQTLNGEEIRDERGRELDSREQALAFSDALADAAVRRRDVAKDLECRSSVRDEEGKVVFRSNLFIPGFTEEERLVLEARKTRRAAAKTARLAKAKAG